MVPGRPLLGSGVEFFQSSTQFIVDCAAKYGPVFSFSALGMPVTVLSGASAAQLVKDHGSGDMDRSGWFDAFREQASFDIFEAMGDTHTRLKHLVRLGYSRQIIIQYLPEIIEESARAAEAWPTDGSVPMLDALCDISRRAVCRALTPVDLAPLDQEVVELFTPVMYVTLNLRPGAVLKNPVQFLRRQRVWASLDAVIARHTRGAFEKNERMSMIDAFLSARTKAGERLTPRDVRGAAIYAIAGTHIYVGRVLAFMLYELLRNPALLARVQDEVDAAFATSPFDPQLLKRMWHLRSVYQEALRVYPPLAGLPFRAARDLTVDGFHIPRGRALLISPVPGHFLSPGYENPLAFDAARCAPPRSEHQCPGGWAPFGIAPRMCVAAGMVEVLSMVITATVVHRRKLSLPSTHYRPTIRMRPLIGPADGLPVRVGERRRASDRVAPADLLLQRNVEGPALAEAWQSITMPTLVPERFQPGDEVIREGEPADFFYIMLSGEAVVERRAEGGVEELARLREGDSFGERGLLKGVPRAATVRAVSEMRVLKLDRDQFLSLAAESDLLPTQLGRAVMERYVRALVSSAMPRLGLERIAALMGGLKIVHFMPGETVFEQGAEPDFVYIIGSGQVEVVLVEPSGARRHVVTRHVGEIFGEIGVLQNRPRTSTVLAGGDSPVVLLALSRESFLKLMDGSSATQSDVLALMGQRLMKLIDVMGDGG